MQADLRFQKTEMALQQALLTQLQTQPLDKISVKALCQQAQISRNAFYQHYESKQHLYDSIINEILIAIQDACHPIIRDLNELNEVTNQAFLTQILTAVADHRQVIQELLKSQPATFSYAFHQMLINASLNNRHLVKHSPGPAYIHTFNGGIADFIIYWIKDTDWDLATAQTKLFNSISFYLPK